MQRYDIHSGKVPVNKAINELEGHIKRSKKLHDKVFSVIVGYGSTGGTHKIKTATLEYLEEALSNHQIKQYICGSDIDIFKKKYQNLEQKYKNDITDDFKREHNPGVIFIWV